MPHDCEKQHRLIHRISLGDQAAFGELYDELISLTLFVCSGHNCSAAETDAVLCLMWMDVWKEAKQISEDPSPIARQILLRTENTILERSTILA